MHLARRNGFHHGIAAVICSLMLFFAVGTKVAAYHSSELAAKPIACAKVWQATKNVLPGAEKVVIAPQAIMLLALLLGLFLAEEVRPIGRETVLHRWVHGGLSPFAVRPPPAR